MEPHAHARRRHPHRAADLRRFEAADEAQADDRPVLRVEPTRGRRRGRSSRRGRRRAAVVGSATASSRTVRRRRLRAIWRASLAATDISHGRRRPGPAGPSADGTRRPRPTAPPPRRCRGRRRRSRRCGPCRRGARRRSGRTRPHRRRWRARRSTRCVSASAITLPIMLYRCQPDRARYGEHRNRARRPCDLLGS